MATIINLRQTAPGQPAPSRAGLMQRLWLRFCGLVIEHRHRRELAALNEAILIDVGIVAGDLEFALSRPLWVPVDLAKLRDPKLRHSWNDLPASRLKAINTD
ncbi:hypothetical protein SAMN07250955_104184 [Arboricoccus pini]|uniref:DUF1127 domain-containing protein n=1 Tax=Arboricoccus pini TaxID=1963835 RepID=A0A212QZ80_9PROT|nr:hypothetical protein [Arboricoccus pini]SNB65034.1 hypothetical protein SAMN07250955_104184 [Arboricoccus pini]